MGVKIFIDNAGFFYKALDGKAKDPSHAERPVVTKEFLQALPDDGTPMIASDIDGEVQKIIGDSTYPRHSCEVLGEKKDEIAV